MIRRIEVQLNRPLQWKICLLHFAELPARHLFIYLDGCTTSPIGPNGPIGTSIRNINENLLPTVQFQRIPSKVPDVDKKLLNGREDVCVLHDLIKAVETGVFDPKYETKKMANMSNVRWFTAFSRVLRVFMQTINPSLELLILVHFILEAYGAMVFGVLLNSDAENGSYLYWQYLLNAQESASKYSFWHASPSIKPTFISKVFVDNSYWAHPECLLYCTMASNFSSQEDRQQAHDLTLEFRRVQARSRAQTVRKFTPPTRDEMNFGATSPMKMLNWDVLKKKKKTPSPKLKHLSVNDLGHLVSKNVVLRKIAKDKISYEKVHSQDCERNIQFVTKIVAKSAGHENQKSKMIVTEESREKFAGRTSITDVLSGLNM